MKALEGVWIFVRGCDKARKNKGRREWPAQVGRLALTTTTTLAALRYAYFTFVKQTPMSTIASTVFAEDSDSENDPDFMPDERDESGAVSDTYFCEMLRRN